MTHTTQQFATVVDPPTLGKFSCQPGRAISASFKQNEQVPLVMDANLGVVRQETIDSLEFEIRKYLAARARKETIKLESIELSLESEDPTSTETATVTHLFLVATVKFINSAKKKAKA